MERPVIKLTKSFFDGASVGDLVEALKTLTPETVVEIVNPNDYGLRDMPPLMATQAFMWIMVDGESHEIPDPNGVWTVTEDDGWVRGKFSDYNKMMYMYPWITIGEQGLDDYIEDMAA